MFCSWRQLQADFGRHQPLTAWDDAEQRPASRSLPAAVAHFGTAASGRTARRLSPLMPRASEEKLNAQKSLDAAFMLEKKVSARHQ